MTPDPEQLRRWREALARGPVQGLDEIVQGLDGPGLEVRDPGLAGRYLPRRMHQEPSDAANPSSLPVPEPPDPWPCSDRSTESSRESGSGDGVTEQEGGVRRDGGPVSAPPLIRRDLDENADALWPAGMAPDPVAEAWLRTGLAVARQMLAASWTDPLTGLLNRNGLRGFLDHHLRLARRRESSLAVLVLDLVGFREVNRTRGHAEGDRVLRDVAGRLVDTLRSSDLVARPGGDEFAAILPDCDEAGAAEAARRILAQLGRRARIGWAIACPVVPAESLLARADQAMRAAPPEGSDGSDRPPSPGTP